MQFVASYGRENSIHTTVRVIFVRKSNRKSDGFRLDISKWRYELHSFFSAARLHVARRNAGHAPRKLPGRSASRLVFPCGAVPAISRFIASDALPNQGRSGRISKNNSLVNKNIRFFIIISTKNFINRTARESSLYRLLVRGVYNFPQQFVGDAHWASRSTGTRDAQCASPTWMYENQPARNIPE